MKTVKAMFNHELRCATCGSQIEATLGEGERHDKATGKWTAPVSFMLLWPCPTCVGAISPESRTHYVIIAMGRAGLAPLGASAAEARDIPQEDDKESVL